MWYTNDKSSRRHPLGSHPRLPYVKDLFRNKLLVVPEAHTLSVGPRSCLRLGRASVPTTPRSRLQGTPWSHTVPTPVCKISVSVVPLDTTREDLPFRPDPPQTYHLGTSLVTTFSDRRTGHFAKDTVPTAQIDVLVRTRRVKGKKKQTLFDVSQREDEKFLVHRCLSRTS